jgi:hypothetical protein
MCLLDRGIILVNLNSDSGPVDLDSDGSGPTGADLTGVNPVDSGVMSSSPASLGPTDIGITDQELPDSDPTSINPSPTGTKPAYGSAVDFGFAGASLAGTFPADMKAVESGLTSTDSFVPDQVDIVLVDTDSVDNNPSEDAANMSPPVGISSFALTSA